MNSAMTRQNYFFCTWRPMICFEFLYMSGKAIGFFWILLFQEWAFFPCKKDFFWYLKGLMMKIILDWWSTYFFNHLSFLIIYIAIFWQFHIILSMHGHTGACCSKRIISWQSGEGKFTTICHCFSHSPLLCEIWQLISTTNLVYRLLVPSAVKSLHIGNKPIIKKHLIWVMRYRFWKISIHPR